MRLIDADALRDLWLYDTFGNECEFCPNDVLNSIDGQPTIEAEPVVHAHWALEVDNGIAVCYHCSNCDADGHHTGIQTATDYCPNCGAHMDEEV